MNVEFKKNSRYTCEYFSVDWLRKEIEDFRSLRSDYPSDSICALNLSFESKTHPLVKDILSSHASIPKALDFSLNNPKSQGGISLCLLGRDLHLLKEEMARKGRRIIKSLQDPNNYETVRFELAVAAAHKIIGLTSDFASVNSDKPDLKISNGENYFFAECKSKQNLFGSTILELAEDLFLRLRENKDENKMIKIPFSLLSESAGEIIQKLSQKLPPINPQLKSKFTAWGHFKGATYLTDTADYLVISDGKTKNLILIEKRRWNGIPKFYFDNLDDAIKKSYEADKPYVVYIDPGIYAEEIHSKEKAKEMLQTIYEDYKNQVSSIVLFRFRPFADAKNKICWGKGFFVYGACQRSPARFFGSEKEDHFLYIRDSGLEITE